MARLPRYVIPGQPQHIILRGNNRQAIFAAEADYQFFRDALVEAADKYGLAIHAYVWMTNHVHLLATLVGRQHQQDVPVGGAALCAVFQLHL